VKGPGANATSGEIRVILDCQEMDPTRTWPYVEVVRWAPPSRIR
jgi:hypothetical protein